MNQHKNTIYRIYIANVTPPQCSAWLQRALIPGATITQGYGYWDELLEPQCTVELSGIGLAALQAFMGHVFEDTDEQAVYVVTLAVESAGEVYRTPFDLKHQHEKSL